MLSQLFITRPILATVCSLLVMLGGVIAIPNPAYPPGDEALAQADLVLDSLASLTAGAVRV